MNRFPRTSRLALGGAALSASLSAALLLTVATAFAGPEISVLGEEGRTDLAPLGDGVSAGAAQARAFAKAPARARRVVRLGALDVRRLKHEDDQERAAGTEDWKHWSRIGVMRTMRAVTVPPTPARWTRAETLSDGSRVFRIEVSAPGATGLRVRFRTCEVPAGSEITVHDADQPEEAYGPLRPDCTGGPDGSGGGWLAPTVFGERAVVSLRVPAAHLRERVRLTVDGVAQRYRAADDAATGSDAVAKSPTRAGSANSSIACIKDVACDAAYAATVARGVARFEFVSGGNVFLCSGTLLADLDVASQTPWFLTANHCVSTDKSARTMEIFWDYRAAICGGSVPSVFSVPRTIGATLVATSGVTDCTLVRITGQLPSNRYFCGWTSARPAAGDSIVGVHHPEGSSMRVSYGTIDSQNAHFHTVVWSDGVTAEGSSGSAIFNASQQVLGQLCCGESFCNRPRAPDDYGRFDISYPAILEDSLGSQPVPTSKDAWDPGDDTSAGATLLGSPTQSGTTQSRHTLVTDDAADWFAAELEAQIPYVFAADGQVRADLFADAAGTQAVATSPGGPTGFSIVAVPQTSGRHWLRVMRASNGVDTSYQLQVSRQDTTPPRAVAKLRSRSPSKGTVTLRWKDRSKDETGYRVDFLGASGWVRVGDLPANTRRFTHQPGPGRQIYRVGPYDAVTTNWRQVSARVRGKPGLDPWDPVDDTGAGATPLGTSLDSLTETHELDRNDAADWFQIDLVQGETWAFETVSDGDTIGTVFADPGGLQALADADDQENGFGAIVDSDFRIVFTAPATATYWVRVKAYPSTPRVTYQLSTTLQ